MTAFEAATANGKASELQRQLEDLFERQNISKSSDKTAFRQRSFVLRSLCLNKPGYLAFSAGDS
jgi:hypothetical protein